MPEKIASISIKNSDEGTLAVQSSIIENLYERIESLEKEKSQFLRKIDQLTNDRYLRLGVGNHTILEVEPMSYLGYYHGVMTSVNAHSKVKIRIHHQPSEGHIGWGHLDDLLPKKWKDMFGTTHEAILDAQQFANLITFFCTGGGDVTESKEKMVT